MDRREPEPGELEQFGEMLWTCVVIGGIIYVAASLFTYAIFR